MKIYRIKFLYRKYYVEGELWEEGTTEGDEFIQASCVIDACVKISECYPDCTIKLCEFVCVVSDPVSQMGKAAK